MATKRNKSVGTQSNIQEDSVVGIIAASFEPFSANYLASIYYGFTGNRPSVSTKTPLSKMVARLLNFRKQEAFDSFFSELPPHIQMAVEIGTFSKYVCIDHLTPLYKNPIIDKNIYYFAYRNDDRIIEESRATMFIAVDRNTLYFPTPLANIFKKWLSPPPESIPIPIEDPQGEFWSLSDGVEESFPLLIDSMGPAISRLGYEETARKGLLKGQIKELRAYCGLKEFPISSSYSLDPINLLTRVIGFIERKVPPRPKDPQEYIKTLIQDFFTYNKKIYGPAGYKAIFLEAFMLVDHLSCPAKDLCTIPNLFECRNTLLDMLKKLGEDGLWYNVDTLILHEEVSDRLHTMERRAANSNMNLKGDFLTIDGCTLNSYDYFTISGMLIFHGLYKPLCKAYFYLMASLGIVDIIENKPEHNLQKGDKRVPLSPYDALSYVRVNDFGKWCLGLCEERPKKKKIAYEAITDSELLLVTFKGNSLERRLFLDQIGEQLGAYRYRINEASFVRGCTNETEVEKRIDKFFELIDADPSEHWIQFFTRVLERSTTFTNPMASLLFDLPDDPQVRKLLITDPHVRKILLRVEGNRIAILAKNTKAFCRLLAKHGFITGVKS